jgi:hypothetical protein
MKRARGIIGVVAVALASSGVALQASAQAAPAAGGSSVLVDGLHLGSSVFLPAGGRPQAFMPLAQLRSAVDGADALSRFLVREHMLLARDTGSCAGCPLRVRRAVVISAGIRVHEGEPHVPVDDVARALDATIREEDGALLLVTAPCDWCILAPVR